MKDDQRITLTKRLLKESLLRLMESRPIDKIGVSELCAESGINRSTFYRYYEVPKDLLLDIEHEIIESIHYENWEIRNMRDVAHYTELILTHMEQHAATLKILLKNNSDEYLTRMLDRFCSLAIQLKLPVATSLEADIDSLRLCSAYTLGGVWFLLREWLLAEVPKTAKEITALIMHCIELGVQLYNQP